MPKPASRSSVLKDFVVLSVLASLLILIPFIRAYWHSSAAGSAATLQRAQSIDKSHQTTALANDTAQDLAFIQEVFPKVSACEAVEINPYLAEETKFENSNRRRDSILDTLDQRLGGLEHFTAPQPIEGLPESTDSEQFAAYEFLAYYESGMAEVNLVLAEDEGEPALHSFNISVQDTQQTL